jgi:hypothetical protein
LSKLIGLVILFIPVVALVLIFKLLRSKPLWLKIPLGLIAPIAAIVVPIPVMQVYFYGFSHPWKCQEEQGLLRKLACGMTKTYEEHAPYFRFLPSDEAMIEHFRKHRADFERLVQISREDPSPPDEKGLWVPPPEAQAIMTRIHVKFVIADPMDVWISPEPYSEEALQQIKTLNLFEKVREGHPEVRKFTGLFVGYDHAPVQRLNEHFSVVRKNYHFIPVVPRVDNGHLITPSVIPPGVGITLFPTLNTYPPDLGSMECAYRQFEPQWFLRMCQIDK